MLHFNADDLRAFAERTFRAAGTDQDLALIVADHLIGSDLTGRDSHGVMRIPQYLGMVRKGTICPNNRPFLASVRGPVAIVDGNYGFGQVTGRFTAERGIERAKQHGVCVVGAGRCNHLGRIGEYAEMAAREGVVSIIAVGVFEEEVAAYGSLKGVLSTNPLAIGFPAGDRTDFVLDFATSAMSGGRLMAASATGQQIPPGILLDRDGKPTTNPSDYLNGGIILAFGGHKGYGLSIATALLAEILVGAEAFVNGNESGNEKGGEKHDQKTNAFFAFVDGDAFRPRPVVEAEADAALGRIDGAPPAPGFDRVRYPGEVAAETRERRLREGIPVPETTWETIRHEANDLGVALPNPR
jgi:hydroxycarboxylate dehydrogenase B